MKLHPPFPCNQCGACCRHVNRAGGCNVWIVVTVFAVTIRLILICVQFMINAHRFAGLKTSIY